jgi:cell division protein FtsB
MAAGEWVPIAGLALQTLLILGGGYAMVVRADMMTKALREEVKAMKEEVKGLASVITTQAVHAERMDNMSKRLTMVQQTVEDLRRGRGYVQERMPQAVDGEYP